MCQSKKKRGHRNCKDQAQDRDTGEQQRSQVDLI